MSDDAGRFRVDTFQRPDGLTAIRLTDQAAASTAEAIPARGGLVSRFAPRGREVLFLDEATVSDPAKNVRGGIPVLFPIAGKLPGGTYRDGEASYALPQHGFGRNRPWAVAGTGTEGAASVTMELEGTPETRAVFPWGFRARLGVSLSGATLAITVSIENPGSRQLPVHYGFHPYFHVPDGSKARARVATPAREALDNRTGRRVSLDAVDLTPEEVDLHLIGHAGGTELTAPGQPPVVLRWDSVYRQLVVWTLRGRDFVCVEPWTAPAGALATGEGLLWLEPGETHESRWEIRVG